MSMGNSLRCCLACVLPCGAFDVVRVVHLNGRVEEYARPVTAREALDAHPNHVLTRPCSVQGGARRILIVAPDSELKRGRFYFLVPASSVPEKKRTPQQRQPKKARPSKCTVPRTRVATKDGGVSYLAEILSENRASSRHHRRRSVRATVWRPHLQSIPEETS